ncbi:type IX secretion system motor protein PorL/GldL [Dysgonomonas macrotermitis]|uniref:Gliding motility-associated protein GldL n=1 Tax=Dysgonomonas macrotermitis TaxID=1346286 RepID=A0A1M5CHM7_9BACT|nr:gliding motility protein GldL [Dysgonomonas macrotermitis]SHF54171.1 gliding motility-associated protein GldL [Dysgonomonas macrotermitis]
MGKKYRKYKNFVEKYLASNTGKRFFNIVYSVGAAIVILGALFKILHLSYGNQMLMIGMITEAIVFLLSAFESPGKDYKWEEVYPVLAESADFVPKAERDTVRAASASSGPVVQVVGGGNSAGVQSTAGGGSVNTNVGTGPAVNTNASGAGSAQQGATGPIIVGGGIIGGGGSVSGGGGTVSGGSTGGGSVGGSSVSGGGYGGTMNSANVVGASEEYVTQLSQMSENMEKFAKVTESLGSISDSLLKSFQTIIDNSAGISSNTQGYVNQIEALNRNITGLNTIYEIQLKGVSGQINTIEHINAGLDRIKKLYDGSLADSSIFKNETEKMAQQLAELNRVYARLLQAMTSNMNMGGGFTPPAGNTPPQP